MPGYGRIGISWSLLQVKKKEKIGIRGSSLKAQ
jgi:hypothetical protein